MTAAAPAPHRRMSRIGRGALQAACLAVTAAALILVFAQMRISLRSLQEVQVRELQARGSAIATRMGMARGGAEAVMGLAESLLVETGLCAAPRDRSADAPRFVLNGPVPHPLIAAGPCLAGQLRLPLSTGQLPDLKRIIVSGPDWSLLLEPALADAPTTARVDSDAEMTQSGFRATVEGTDAASEVRYVAVGQGNVIRAVSLTLATDVLWAQTFPLSGPEGEVFLFAPDGTVIVRGGVLPGLMESAPLPGRLGQSDRVEILNRLAGHPADFAGWLLLGVLRLPDTDWFLVSASALPSLAIWLVERNAAVLIFALAVTLGAWTAYFFVMATLVRPSQRLEDALDRSRTNLTVTFDHVAEGLCLIGADGDIVTANDRLAHLMDLSPSFIAPGTAVLPLLQALDLTSVTDANGNAARDVVRDDGHWLEATLRPVTGRGLSILLVRDVTERKRSEIAVRDARDAAQSAYARSEELLLNVLPQAIAERLKAGEREIADGLDQVTILFADIVGFTRYTASRPPAEVVRLLNRVFSQFDALCTEFGVEKLKTIGDGYMAVAGAPISFQGHEIAAARLALAMQAAVAVVRREEPEITMRIGMNVGSAIAGVMGTHKFAYDVWGDAVNVASRLEATAAPGTITVSAALAERLAPSFDLTPLGQLDLKGKGAVAAFRLIGPKGGL